MNQLKIFVSIVLLALCVSTVFSDEAPKSGATATGEKQNTTDVAKLAAAKAEQAIAGSIAVKGADGWMYSKNELAHLAAGPLAGGKVSEHSKSTKKENANPIPAIEAFHRELKDAGIRLIVVPVPPKAALVPFDGLKKGDAMMYLRPFYGELQAKGIEVLDLYDKFAASDKAVYCKQDAHWNPEGIRIAAQAIADALKLPPGTNVFEGKQEKIKITGDLMLASDKNAKPSEEIELTKYAGKTVDETSQVLLIGDSHTLVFSSGGDMLAEHAGLVESLAAKLKMPIDRIGVKGSASTAVRIQLYRKAVKDEAWLKNKKAVIWCFTAREFTESSAGWVTVPVFKKK